MIFIAILVCVEWENYLTIENSINSLIQTFRLSEQNILLFVTEDVLTVYMYICMYICLVYMYVYMFSCE